MRDFLTSPVESKMVPIKALPYWDLKNTKPLDLLGAFVSGTIHSG